MSEGRAPITVTADDIAIAQAGVRYLRQEGFTGWDESIGKAFVAGWRGARSVGISSWIPADPDGLPPLSYPSWRARELARRHSGAD